jgi:hypothetical protein
VQLASALRAPQEQLERAQQVQLELPELQVLEPQAPLVLVLLVLQVPLVLQGLA